jgi:hypothetical protein
MILYINYSYSQSEILVIANDENQNFKIGEIELPEFYNLNEIQLYKKFLDLETSITIEKKRTAVENIYEISLTGAQFTFVDNGELVPVSFTISEFDKDIDYFFKDIKLSGQTELKDLFTENDKSDNFRIFTNDSITTVEKMNNRWNYLEFKFHSNGCLKEVNFMEKMD